jgi:hypothetical protein
MLRRSIPAAVAASIAGLTACGQLIGDRSTSIIDGEAGADAAGLMESGPAQNDGSGGAQDGNSDSGAAAPDATAPVEASVDAAAVGPATVQPDRLRLWLRAESVSCQGGRVARWADQSGRGNDAEPHGQLAPQCQVGHTINGTDVPYFSAPVSAQSPNYVDETLDVDLSFLVGTEYTLFAVERRRADRLTPDGGIGGGFVLGTTLADQSARPSCDGPRDIVLEFGYAYWVGYPALDCGQGCDGVAGAVNSNVSDAGLLPAAYDTARLDSNGKGLWQNGTLVQSWPNSSPIGLNGGSGGAIGRAETTLVSSGVDMRYQGDIAEVVVYDTALADDELATIEAYLKARWAL